MTRVIVLLAVLISAGPTPAQDEGAELERIEVTGSNISYADLDTPAVSITKPGDYLLQEVLLVNDTRDRALREREIHETIKRMLSAAGDRYTLLHGDAYRVRLNRGNHRIEVVDDPKRPDTGEVVLQLRAALTESARAEALAREMRAFVKDAARVGRTEITADGETALGMSKPERYRYDLIAAIAQDTSRVTQALGLRCELDLDGLESRIEWERVSAGELMLYIPYSMTVSGCSQAPAAAAQ